MCVCCGHFTGHGARGSRIESPAFPILDSGQGDLSRRWLNSVPSKGRRGSGLLGGKRKPIRSTPKRKRQGQYSGRMAVYNGQSLSFNREHRSSPSLSAPTLCQAPSSAAQPLTDKPGMGLLPQPGLVHTLILNCTHLKGANTGATSNTNIYNTPYTGFSWNGLLLSKCLS